MKTNKIIYSPIIPIVFTVVVASLVIGFQREDDVFQRHDNNVNSANKISNSTATVKIEESETARLAIDGSVLKILTNTVLYNRNFVFLDNATDDIVSTLSVGNPVIETPDYKIIKGHAHDWLVVVGLNAGTGFKEYFNEWYILLPQGNMKMVLSYPSRGHNAQLYERTEYLETNIINESYPDDSAVDVKFILKDCFTTQSGEDKNCSESSHIAHYVWDSDKEEFVFDSKKSDISEQGIDGLLWGEN